MTAVAELAAMIGSSPIFEYGKKPSNGIYRMILVSVREQVPVAGSNPARRHITTRSCRHFY